jgi:hypothetical protein
MRRRADAARLPCNPRWREGLRHQRFCFINPEIQVRTGPAAVTALIEEEA